MEEKILSVVEEYKKTNSIEQTAKNMNLSTGTVRKMLVTAGAWSNKTVIDIRLLRREHPEWNNIQIAERLKISSKAVHLYSPYKGLASMSWSYDNTIMNDEEQVEVGDCGDKVTWKLTKSGKLTIAGTGPMWDYNSRCYGMPGNPRPKWWARRDGIKVKSIIVEDGVTSIGQYAFAELVDLESVSLPSSINEIKGGAFAGENYLRKILLPKNVEYIAWDTFYLNIYLEEIVIPEKVYKIQTYAFHGCVSLRRIFFYGDAPRISMTSFDRCPEGAITVYHTEKAKGWGEKWNGYKTEVLKCCIC